MKEVLASASTTLLAKSKDKTVHVPFPSLPHINWYTVAACFIVAAFLMWFLKKNKLVALFAAGALTAVALHLGVHPK